MVFRDDKFRAYMNITISPRKDVLFELVTIQIYSGNNLIKKDSGTGVFL